MFINIRKIIFWITMLLAISASAGIVTDMAGRKVEVPSPDEIKRVFTASTAVSYLVYAVAPEKLCGLNRPWRPGDKKYLVPSIRNKPVLGGWLGQGGRISNSEEVLATGPQLVFASMVKRSSLGNKIEKNLKMLKVPLLFVSSSELKGLPEAFTFIGKVTGESARAEKLCKATNRLLKKIAKLKPPVKGRPRIYYCFSPDGLHTSPGRNPLTESFYQAGGMNVFDANAKTVKNPRERISGCNGPWRAKMSLEKILEANPDVILTGSKRFYHQVYKSPKWQALNAVKQHRCYLIPSSPMSWLDRPASFMRLLGVLWLAHIIDPTQVSKAELIKETVTFYELFLQCEINSKEAITLLERTGK